MTRAAIFTLLFTANLAPAQDVAGRIVQMTHAGSALFIGIAFDIIEEKGVAWPFYAKLVSPPPAIERGSQGNHLTGHGIRGWPHSTFSFRASRPVVPAGFQSVWITVTPPAPN
jgi:hypothetical protein